MIPAYIRAHVFVDDVGAPRLRPDDHRHLTRVLRLAPADAVTAGDGRGRWRLCRLGPDLELDVAGEVIVEPAPEPRLTVAFALVKGDRPELVVQKLTELGIDCIVPFVAERSVVRWDADRVERHHRRFVTIAREAAMQSRAPFVPDVAAVTTFSEAAARPGAVLADRDGDPLSLSTPTVLVGPEGGWGTTEREAGLASVRLGEHVLRAETAAFTAGALLGALRSRLVLEAIPPQVRNPHGP